ncbi:MAG TPA: LPP20 family lipoprotein [Treponemataceae bacterium]|nr:LPP20 family lipoprotein [Treponemataceae bacterium]
MHKIIPALAAVFLLVGCASSGSSGSAGKGEKKVPEWVHNPRSKYNEAQFVSAVGQGSSREAAEKSATNALVSIFGQNIKGETTINERYTEALRNGTITVTEDSSLSRDMTSSVSMNSVIGAEIKDVWDDGSGMFYAVSVMDKIKASPTYAGLLETNEETIAKLTDIEDKTTFDAYARYDLAATIADTSLQFVNVLSIINPAQAAAKRGSLSSADTFRLECVSIAQNIPVEVVVHGDREDRIKSAFSGVLATSGFKTGKSDSRYFIEVSFSLTEAVLVNNANKFVRYIIDARLTDRETGKVLLPFSLNGREGHTSVSEAENRALRTTELKIKSEYSLRFSEFLTKLTR